MPSKPLTNNDSTGRGGFTQVKQMISKTEKPMEGSLPPPIWGQPIRWGQRRWPTIPPPNPSKKTMAIITMNVSDLTLLQKLARGATIIEFSLNNENVPNNGPLVAKLQASQTALEAAEAAVIAHRTLAEQLIAARDAALETWLADLTGLAGFTESATGGVAEKILTTGFGVRGLPSPPQPVSQILNVRVSFNGEPGKSIVSWKRDTHADAYVVECCPDPITPTGWKYMKTVKPPKFQGNGATPGQACWYRVRGINGAGEGPWSEPALRPVM
jgi:hypothetical protein